MALLLDLSESESRPVLPLGKPAMPSQGKHSSKHFNRLTFSKFSGISIAPLRFGLVFVMNTVVALTSNISVSTLSFKAFAKPRKLQWMPTSLGLMNSFKNSSTTSRLPYLHYTTKQSTCNSFNHSAMTKIGNSSRWQRVTIYALSLQLNSLQRYAP